MAGRFGFLRWTSAGRHRADAHPDAPPRRPIHATEELAASRALPVDLDTPLAAYGAVSGEGRLRTFVPQATISYEETARASLRERLEGQEDAPVSLEDTLKALRRLATG